MKYYRLATDANHTQALYNLGLLYVEGSKTTPAEYTEGLQMLHRAADLNLTEVHFKQTVIDLDINRNFPRPDFGANIDPFTIKKWTKTSQNGVSFLHFGEIFMKIWTKIAKLQMHENLHKNSHLYAIFHEFLWRAIKATKYITALYC